jgi:branched-subunit amino acid ABC-type transport system permease component
MPDFVLQLPPHLLNAVALGLLFALVALGFMLIIGVMEVINLAHGSFFALGAYFALAVIAPDGGLPFAFMDPWYDLPAWPRYVIALIVAPVLVGIVGMGLEVCLRPTYGTDPLYGLLLTFGAALVLEELIRVVWGSSEYYIPTPRDISGGFILGGLIYSTYRIYAAVFAMAMIGLLWLFLNRTPYGAVIKAGAHDSEMVRALGYNLKRLRLMVFGFGCALAGIAGIIMAPIWGVRPGVGVDAVIPAFVIIVLGGVGSFWGAVSAGLMVGLVVGMSAAFVTDWSLLSMYLLLLAVVIFRPRGLAGKTSILER